MLATALLAAALTIHEIATMPTLSSPIVSPDGKRIVYVMTRADMERKLYDSDLWLVNADGSNDIELTRTSGMSNHPRWSPDGSKIAFLSNRDGGRNAIWMIGANGGEAGKLTDEKGGIGDFEFSPDGKTIAFTMRDAPPSEKEDFRVVGADVRPSHLYLIDLDSRRVTPLTSGGDSFTNISWSPDGSQIAAERQPSGTIQDYQKSDIALVARNGDVHMLVTWPGSDRNPTFSPDGKSIAFISAGGVADWLREEQIHVVPVGGGTPRLVSQQYNRTPDQVRWLDPQTIVFDGAWNTTGQMFRVGADGSGFRDVSHVNAVIEGLDVRNGIAAFVMESLTAPPELFVSDVSAFAPRQITHHNDALLNRELGETKLIHWKNPKDGVEIEGLLTLPIGYQPGRRYPLLTFVHGGPASHFFQGFVGYLGYLYPVNVFAANGFAVLRPNPRGTGGYGQQFREANRNDWGGMDWMDINAGIDKVIADGIADPNRLGLMGWSYGGFMTSWAEGHSTRLKAISIGAPVVDLLSFHGTTDIRAFIPSYFREQADFSAPNADTDDPTLNAMRHSPLNLDLLREHSPLWHVKPSSAQVLIQQDDGDERVPLSQGIMLYRVLQELGVDVTMMIYHSPGHTPRVPQERIDVMQANVDLFTRALGERPSPPQSSGVTGDWTFADPTAEAGPHPAGEGARRHTAESALKK